MNLLFALVFAGVGFAALALAMDRHHRQVRKRTPTGRQRVFLRVTGVVGLTAALALCVVGAGWGTGVVVWLGLLTVAALAMVLTLTYWQARPR